MYDIQKEGRLNNMEKIISKKYNIDVTELVENSRLTINDIEDYINEYLQYVKTYGKDTVNNLHGIDIDSMSYRELLDLACEEASKHFYIHSRSKNSDPYMILELRDKLNELIEKGYGGYLCCNEYFNDDICQYEKENITDNIEIDEKSKFVVFNHTDYAKIKVLD